MCLEGGIVGRGGIILVRCGEIGGNCATEGRVYLVSMLMRLLRLRELISSSYYPCFDDPPGVLSVC